jgi:L-threonylcarbamoyladenylate synthase
MLSMSEEQGPERGGVGWPEHELGLKTERLRAEDVDGVARAAELLRAGGTVAFPTETVYGLGANALDAAAVAKIFLAKQRPAWDPMIVHVEGRAMLERVAAVPAGDEGRVVTKLMEAFWPGPLTLLLPRTAAVPDAVTAGRPLVGVRMPAHPVALELIRRAGVPIAAPSANRFGGTSPTTAAHVLADLDGRIDAVLDGGATSVGVESTVLDVAARAIYRPGAVTAAMIAEATGEEVRVVSLVGVVEEEADSSAALRNDKQGLRNDKQERRDDKLGGLRNDMGMGLASPGMGMRHYAPRARLVLVEGQKGLLREIANYSADEVGVMLPDGWDVGAAEAVFRWGAWNDAETLARRLFAGLREMDAHGVKAIVCPVPQMGGLGDALRDRLGKAARAK